ncbi:MAG TPA: hypothetical protein VHE82_01820 [Gemmatimonadaceae bacterium]|nr:hypothetical protein [Gemmatimonadaceae bacterium]
MRAMAGVGALVGALTCGSAGVAVVDARTTSSVVVEFYTMTSVPPQYRRGTGSCQVMLIWSKY